MQIYIYLLFFGNLSSFSKLEFNVNNFMVQALNKGILSLL